MVNVHVTRGLADQRVRQVWKQCTGHRSGGIPNEEPRALRVGRPVELSLALRESMARATFPRDGLPVGG